jgi:hypothetical protein
VMTHLARPPPSRHVACHLSKHFTWTRACVPEHAHGEMSSPPRLERDSRSKQKRHGGKSSARDDWGLALGAVVRTSPDSESRTHPKPGPSPPPHTPRKPAPRLCLGGCSRRALRRRNFCGAPRMHPANKHGRLVFFR